MKCLCPADQLATDEMVESSKSLARSFSVGGFPSLDHEDGQGLDIGNIEEAESSLRESVGLNYEEARALLGRLEYQRGNFEAAVHVFEGISIVAVVSKIKFSIERRDNKRRPPIDAATPVSIHTVNLLLEAIYLKGKSLQELGRYEEAAQSCKVILDTIEPSLSGGLPENLVKECKLQEIVNRSVELLPELWKFGGFFHEAILSYRRALLHQWNLDVETTARIQKEFAIFLLYSGVEADPLNILLDVEGYFIPGNNIEEAVLLLSSLLNKISMKMIDWDPSIINHLSFALAVSGELKSLASQFEKLLPGVLGRNETYYTLALCYYGEGEDSTALNLLKNLLSSREDTNCVLALLLASKISGGNPNWAEEGVGFARKALANLPGVCNLMLSVANYLLGISLSTQARSHVSDSERIAMQHEALQALETAGRIVGNKDPNIICHLSLEYAEQRKLDIALHYATQLLKIDAGSNNRVWILLARILSAQKRFIDAETIINAALEQTDQCDKKELLQTKAKLQIAQGKFKNAVKTYTHLLAIIQVQSKGSINSKLPKGRDNYDGGLEPKTWHDLANVYISLSKWRDAEICISKSRAITAHSASRLHATGVLYKAQGLQKEALKSFADSLDFEPTHVPSLVSIATILRQLPEPSFTVARGFLSDALKLDRKNPSAWYNLGLLYKAGGFVLEAAECFEAAVILEQSAPVEPFK